MRSALGAGKGGNPVFLVFVGQNKVFELDNIVLTDLIAKGMVKEFRWRHGRKCLRCVDDGGSGAFSTDVHRLVQKLISAAQIQFTYATRSSRARQIAGKVVCGS